MSEKEEDQEGMYDVLIGALLIKKFNKLKTDLLIIKIVSVINLISFIGSFVGFVLTGDFVILLIITFGCVIYSYFTHKGTKEDLQGVKTAMKQRNLDEYIE